MKQAKNTNKTVAFVIGWLIISAILLAMAVLIFTATDANAQGSVISMVPGDYFGDPYRYIVVVGNDADTLRVSDRHYIAAIGDTIGCSWVQAYAADLAGYQIMFVSDTLKHVLTVPTAITTVKADTVHYRERLFIRPGGYYVAVRAYDATGNRSPWSVAAMVVLTGPRLMPPKMVRIVLW